MTRDDIRKLIGGYATGTLTESERKLLFDAALEDQELFDEIAREQELKELIATPGVRDRLVAALAPTPQVERERWWTRKWTWATAAGVLAAAVVIATLIPRTPEPQEVASVQQAQPQDKVSDAPAPAVQPVPQPPPAAEQAPQPANRVRSNVSPTPPSALKDGKAEKAADSKAATEPTSVAEKKEADQVPVPAAAAPPPVVLQDQIARQQQTASQRSAEQQTPAALAEQRRDQAGQAGQPQNQSVAVTQDAPLLRTEQTANGVIGGAPQTQQGFRAQNPPPPAKPAARAVAAKVAATQQAFTYTVANGVLRLTPAVNGYLQMTVSAPGQSTAVPQQQVFQGTPFQYPVPPNADTIVLGFSLAPGGISGAPESKPIAGSVDFTANGPRIALIRIPAR